MKKFLLFALPVPVLAAAAVIVWQNLPSKRFAKHMIKARLYSQEGNLTAARIEYEKAYSARGGFTPYVSPEVLVLTNRMNIQDRNPRQALENTRKFAETHKDNLEGKSLLAELALQMGETELGFDALDDLLAADPSNFRGRLLLTRVRSQQGRLDLAEEQLRYLYTRYPDSAQALLPLAEVLIGERRSPESREFLRRALAKQPKNARARLMLVDSYLIQRDFDSAQLMLDQWQESDPDRKQQVQLRKARLYSAIGKWDEAEAALAPYLQPKEENLEALADLAVMWARRGGYDSALSIYRSIGDISPKARGTSLMMSYYLYMKSQNPARALEALKTLQVNSPSPALLPPLVAAYQAIGQDNKAKELIEQQPDSLKGPLGVFLADLPPDKEFIGQWALITYFGITRQAGDAYRAVEDFHKRWPKQRIPIEMRASQLSAQGRFAEAAKVMSALDDPTQAQRLTYLQLLSKSGDAAKARGVAEKLAADFPDLKGVNLALADSWSGSDKAKAMAYYKKELELNPGNLIALNNLAWEYGVVEGDLAKARPYLDKLKAAKNPDPRIHDTIGWILAVNGDLAGGERYLRNALQMVPDFPSFQYHLAYVLKRAGKPEEARKLLQRALAAKGAFEERREAEKLLADQG